MKLAILIGVSEYLSQQNLSASKNDVKLIKSIIDLSGDYSNVLYIDSETNTRQVKNKISDFIAQNSDKEIDEVFFYFSGHGLFNGSDFYYVMSDFDGDKIKSTSLENSELDTMVKSLRPKLTVKIIDACNSGLSYIKDPGALSKYINESKLGFSKCYFMFSSEDAQYSYADAHLSFFTKAIGRAIATTEEDTVRYKDIIDFVSDEFNGNENQSPVFVSQASFTEIFIKSVSTASKKLLDDALSIKSELALEAKKQPLKELVAEDAKRYFSQEKAMGIYDSIPELMMKNFKLKGEVKDLFFLKVEPFNSYDLIPKLPLLAEWVDNNNDDLFVKAVKERREREVKRPKSNISTLLIGFGANDEENYKLVKESYLAPVSIESLLDSHYKAISVFAEAKYPNINSAKLYVLPLLSKTKLVILSSIVSYKSSGWDYEVMVDNNIKWTPHTIELASKDGLNIYLNNLEKNFESELLNTILKNFNLLPESKG